MKIANEWKSILLKDVGPFKDVSFDIPRGITTIYGANNNSSDTNAAGKSMLFSSIFDTLYEAPIAAEKTDRIRTGTRGVKLTLGGKPLLLKREGAKSSLKIGDALIHGAVNVRKKLAETLPWTWEDVVTYIHLDSQTPHPLVKGSNAGRKEFLTKFFGLDKIDAEKRLIKSQLDKVSGAAEKYRTLVEERDLLRKSLPPKDLVPKLTKKATTLQSTLDTLQEGAAEADQSRRAALFREQAASEIEHYHRACDEAGSDELKAQIAYYEDEVNRNLGLLEHAVAYEEWNQKQGVYQDWVRSLSPETLAFLKSGRVEKDPQAIAAKLDKARYRMGDIQDELAGLSTLCAEKIRPVQKPARSLGEARAALESAEHQLHHAKKFGSGKCPTCGQHVEVADVARLQATMKSARNVVNAHADYQQYQETVAEQAKLRKRFSNLRDELNKIRAFCEKNKQFQVIARELNSAPQRPPEFTGKRIDAKSIRAVISELEVRLKALQFLQSNATIFEQALELPDDSDFAASNIEQVATLTRELTQIEAKLSRAKALIPQYRELSARIDELKPKLGRANALEALLSGYDDKAMKKLVIQALSKRLNQQIDKYASIVFHDQFKFELVWEAHQVQFLVHRHFGDRTDTTDVRRLSGAETKLFTLALVMALLAFVPDEKRSSMIVLDEPANAMGPSNMQRFQELLLVLNRMIPSIVIITPKPEERYGGNEFTIAKIRGTTTIRTGHPSTIQLRPREVRKTTRRLSRAG